MKKEEGRKGIRWSFGKWKTDAGMLHSGDLVLILFREVTGMDKNDPVV